MTVLHVLLSAAKDLLFTVEEQILRLRLRMTRLRLRTTALAFAILAACGGTHRNAEIIGLITKTETNPFFVKMKEGAEAAAQRNGVKLLTGAGRNDGDNAGQVTAMENMMAAGARVILITVNDAKAIVPTLERARAKGVLVIALDSPPDPVSAVDALYATDNYAAGTLIGEYARAAHGPGPAKIATLDLFPGHPVGAQRHNGFLKGFGLPTNPRESNLNARPAEVVCMADSYGNQSKGQAGMENCLQKNPDIDVVYTINEPTAAGAYRALTAVGRQNKVTIVSVDGGCDGIRAIAAGQLAATAQQYPVKMAELGVDAGVQFLRTGRKPSGYTDTGVSLIALKAMPGVPSKDVQTGMALCFGRK